MDLVITIVGFFSLDRNSTVFTIYNPGGILGLLQENIYTEFFCTGGEETRVELP